MTDLAKKKVKRVPELSSILRIRSVPRQHVLISEDPTIAWLLRSGTAGIFHSQIENGFPVGRRHFLFRARAGDAVLSLVDNHGGSIGRLVLIASDEVTLVEIPLDRIEEGLLAEGAAITDAVEGWVHNV